MDQSPHTIDTVSILNTRHPSPSWAELLEAWQTNQFPKQSLFFNGKPIEILIAPIAKGDIKAFILLIYQECLIGAVKESDPSSLIEAYQSLITRYHLPKEPLFRNDTEFETFINQRNDITEPDKTVLLDETKRDLWVLGQYIQEKTNPVRAHFHACHKLRLQFSQKGQFYGFNEIIRHRLTDNALSAEGVWSIQIHIDRQSNSHLKKKEHFSYGDKISSLQNDSQTSLEAVGENKEDTFHFRGECETELVPTQTGFKGRCVSAQIIVYTDSLFPYLNQSSLIERLLKDIKDLKKQIASIDTSNPSFKPITAKLDVSYAAIDYLYHKMSAKDFTRFLFKHQAFEEGNSSDKTSMHINSILTRYDFPLSNVIPIHIEQESAHLKHAETKEEKQALNDKIVVLSNAQKYLTNAISKSDFEAVLKAHPHYLDTSLGIGIKSLVNALLRREGTFSKKTAKISTQEKDIIDLTSAYLNASISASTLYKSVEHINFKDNTRLLEHLQTAIDKKPYIRVSLFIQTQKLNQAIKNTKEPLEKSLIKKKIALFSKAHQYLNGEVTRLDFTDDIKSLKPLVDIQDDADYLLLKTVTETKPLILVERIHQLIEDSTFSKEDSALLNQAILYLQEKCKLTDFQTVCLDYPDSANTYGKLCNEVLDAKRSSEDEIT